MSGEWSVAWLGCARHSALVDLARWGLSITRWHLPFFSSLVFVALSVGGRDKLWYGLFQSLLATFAAVDAVVSCDSVVASVASTKASVCRVQVLRSTATEKSIFGGGCFHPVAGSPRRLPRGAAEEKKKKNNIKYARRPAPPTNRHRYTNRSTALSSARHIHLVTQRHVSPPHFRHPARP